MWFTSRKKITSVDKEKIIAEIHDLVLKQYARYDIQLVKNTSRNGVIELRFLVAGEDVLNMSIDSSMK